LGDVNSRIYASKEELINYEDISRAPARLRWMQLTSSVFELTAGEHSFGSLQFQGSRAIGTAADGKWNFDLGGFLQKRIKIRELKTLRDVGSIALGGADAGVLVDPGGSARLSTLVWSQRQRAWTSEDDWLIRFQPGGESSADLFKFQYDVELDNSIRNLRELSLLILIGWYALALTRRNR